MSGIDSCLNCTAGVGLAHIRAHVLVFSGKGYDDSFAAHNWCMIALIVLSFHRQVWGLHSSRQGSSRQWDMTAPHWNDGSNMTWRIECDSPHNCVPRPQKWFWFLKGKMLECPTLQFKTSETPPAPCNDQAFNFSLCPFADGLIHSPDASRKKFLFWSTFVKIDFPVHSTSTFQEWFNQRNKTFSCASSFPQKMQAKVHILSPFLADSKRQMKL